MQTVLVVDDVQTDRELVGKMVERQGYRVVYASTGAEAIEIAKKEKPSLIFLDVVMPVMDGFKTCRALKTDDVTSKIPVVLVTSKGTDSDMFWGKKQGADDHIIKPFSPASLIDAMKRYIR